MTFYLGVDLGQAADYTALAIVEKLWPSGEPLPERYNPTNSEGRTTKVYPPTDNSRRIPAFHCRHLERFTLGTPYPTVVRHVVDLLDRPALRGHTQLIIDATGVGRPVVDMIRQAKLDPIAITIHGGDQVTFEGGWRVPKRDLVSMVAVLLQSDRLKFAADLPVVGTLVQELLAFRVKISEAGHDSYGAWREGTHDDLVLALACAVWWGERDSGRRHFRLASSSYYSGRP